MCPDTDKWVSVALAVLVVGAGFCPAAVPGDLIVNGSFEAGNSGFGTDLGCVPTPPFGLTQNGVYAIAQNPADWFYASPWANMGDHTTGSGNMFLATPDPGSDRIWYESLNLIGGTVYTFSGWAAWVSLLDQNRPVLSLIAGGNSLGVFDLSTLPAGTWGQFSFSYTAASTGPVLFSIMDLALSNDGNDFALDDLTFAPVPEPGSLGLLGLGAVVAVIKASRAKRRNSPE